jgi:hypothetical protein
MLLSIWMLIWASLAIAVTCLLVLCYALASLAHYCVYFLLEASASVPGVLSTVL